MTYLSKTKVPAFLYNADETTQKLARRLRKSSTDAENILWQKLRRRQLCHAKFRRQHPVGFYIADFYCHEARLVVEVDGPVHNSGHQKEHDENRSAEMDRLGIRVLRFTNEQVINEIDSVIAEIISTLTSLPFKGRAGEGS